MKNTGKVMILAFLMLAMSVSVPAEEKKSAYDGNGVNITYSGDYAETAGLVIPYPIGAIDDEHHIYMLAFYYEGLPKEEAQEILDAAEPSEEEVNAFKSAQGTLGVLISADVDYDRIREFYDSEYAEWNELDYDQAMETGSADGFTFYIIPTKTDEEYLSSIDEEFAEEFRNLHSELQTVMKGAEYYAPVDQAKNMTGQKIEFTTTDLDGNTVTSEELFSDNEITMINCWGVWCPNCVVEMPELADMHERMQEKGCGIVGLEWEKNPSEEIYQQARDSMAEWGTNYPNVLMPDDLSMQIEAYPTTFFVDRQGVVLDMPIVGAMPSGYESALDELLGAENAAAQTEAETETKAGAGLEAVTSYQVRVTDEDGPVAGVWVELCNDTACRFAETDEDGVADFEVPAGKDYEAHVLEVPDGYKEDDTPYPAVDDSGEVAIQLEKEG